MTTCTTIVSLRHSFAISSNQVFAPTAQISLQRWLKGYLRLIEVKKESTIDDELVKAKATAVDEIAV